MKAAQLMLAGAVMALSANAANAYFVEDYGYNIGKATVKATGGCAMPTQVFENARYGNIYTDAGMGSYVAYGLIDADGNILATEADYATIKGFDQTRISDSYGKSLWVYFEDYNSDDTESYIEGAAGCNIDELTAVASSKETYNFQGPNVGPADKEGISLFAKLVGFTNRVCETVTTSATSTYKCASKPVGVTITFKGTN